MFGDKFLDLQIASDRDYIYEEGRQHSFFSQDIYPNQKHQQKQMAKIPVSFFLEDYPQDFSQANPFCPLCSKFISKTQPFMIYHSNHKRKKYLIHSECASTQEGKCLILSESPQAKLQSIAFLNQMRSLSLGGKEFYFQIEVLHPLGGFSLAKLWTKLQSIGNFVTWDIKTQSDSDCFCPNIVAFPFPDFQLVVNLIEIGQRQGKLVKKMMISVGRLGGNEVQLVKAYTPDCQIMMRVIGDKEEQMRTIDQMNLKYRYPLDIGASLVQLVRIQIKLPQAESDEEEDDDFSRKNSSIPELMSQKTSQRDLKNVHNSEALSERSFDKQKVDLQKLISSQKLGQFVRQNTQSRVFQGWLGEATPREVDEVITALWQQFPDLITHEYANYMIQKLMGVCSLPQRVKIVQRLQSDIPGIARNKQGTHSLQTLITLLTTDQQYHLVTQSIKKYFLSLSQHPNATHFLQKIVSLFPISHTIDFMEMVIQDFLSYSLDKHAMCVIKQMIKKISELENNEKEGPAYEMRKKFVHIVNFNIDQLIGDPYGNYIIQFCYEFFGEDKCGGITQRIIDKLLAFSLQKYSSAVVFKCIHNYWTNKDTVNKLRNALTNELIHQMFRNRDANKVLLQIVQRYKEEALREKIKSQLKEPTKFNHDRWGVALGCRTGEVGTVYTSFSDAVRKPQRKRRNNNN